MPTLAPGGVLMLHLSPMGHPQVKLMLASAGVEVMSLQRGRRKPKQRLFLWSLVLFVKLYTRLWSGEARRRYLLDDLEGPALLTGGNTLIIQARKARGRTVDPSCIRGCRGLGPGGSSAGPSVSPRRGPPPAEAHRGV